MEFILFHTYDGQHMEGSLHFKNRAFDGCLPAEHGEEILSTLRLALGPEYDVVLEYPTDEKPGCLHVEWDPK
jgi:hypothetical protein